MSQPHYQEQFRSILGTTAWPGTLNIKVEQDHLVHYIALRNKAGIDTLDADAASLEQARHRCDRHGLCRDIPCQYSALICVLALYVAYQHSKFQSSLSVLED